MSRVSVLVGVLALSSSAFASNFSFTGNFLLDNDLQKFIFTIASPGTVTMQTWSFAGGTNINGSLVPAGGFAPVLALFDSTGTIVGNFDEGGTPPSACGPRNIDAASGLCLDAFLSDSLVAGTYTLILSQQDNIPLSAFLSDGYQHDGDPNFAGGFNDFGFQRTSRWEVDIVHVDSAHEVTGAPEPGSALGMLTGLIWMMRKRLTRS
jgi:hypothetical protein